MEYFATGKIPATIEAHFPINARGWFITSEECSSESNVNEFVIAVQNGLKAANSRAKARKLEADDIDYLVREAVNSMQYPIEAAYSFLSLRVTGNGGAVSNSYGSAADADFIVINAVPGVGILCEVWRGHAKNVPNGASKSWRFEYKHPVLGWRTSQERWRKPLGYKTQAGARKKAIENARTETRDGLVSLPDGTFAGYCEANGVQWVYGPDWEASFSAVESIGGSLIA